MQFVVNCEEILYKHIFTIHIIHHRVISKFAVSQAIIIIICFICDSYIDEVQCSMRTVDARTTIDFNLDDSCCVFEGLYADWKIKICYKA